MHKTTEELKREMYTDLKRVGSMVSTTHLFKTFEESLEAYLEALRKEAADSTVRIDHLERMGDVLRDGYMYQQQLTQQARSEADRQRNQHQALHYANGIAGGELREARALIKQQRELIKRQRQSIGQLKQERNDALHLAQVRTSQREVTLRRLREALKDRPCTSAQSVEENAPELSVDDLTAIDEVVSKGFTTRKISFGAMARRTLQRTDQ